MKNILVLAVFAMSVQGALAQTDGVSFMPRVAAVNVTIDRGAGTTYTLTVANADRTTTKTSRVFVGVRERVSVDAAVPRLSSSGHLDPLPWRVRVTRKWMTGDKDTLKGKGQLIRGNAAIVTLDPLAQMLQPAYQDLALSTSLITAAQAHNMRVYWSKLVVADHARQQAAADRAIQAAVAAKSAIDASSALIAD